MFFTNFSFLSYYIQEEMNYLDRNWVTPIESITTTTPTPEQAECKLSSI